MFDHVYGFFFGDQLRKRVVLLSAFFLGQLFAFPFFGRVEPQHYVALAVSIACISIWPLMFFYNRCTRVRPLKGNELIISHIFTDDKSIRDVIVDLTERNILSKSFLHDFERAGYPNRNRLDFKNNIEQVLRRVEQIKFSDEKYISAVLGHIEKIIVKKTDMMKVAGMSDETVSGGIKKMVDDLYSLEVQWDEYIDRLLEEHQKKNEEKLKKQV